MLFSDKITAILPLALYKINSKTRLDLTALTQNRLPFSLSKIKSAQVTTS